MQWGRLKSIASGALMLVLSLFFACGLVEGGLRLVFFKALRLTNLNHLTLLRPPHPTRGWVPEPNTQMDAQTLDYSTHLAFNSAGLRDREHAYEPAPGVFRIALLGDSFMEACHVELEQTLSRRLETALAARHVEVINFGVTGYGCAQEYLTLKEEALTYKPNLVLLALYAGNDFRNDNEWLETRIQGPESFSSWGRPYPLWDDAKGALEFRWPDYARAQRDYRIRKMATEIQEASRPWYTYTATHAVSQWIFDIGGRPAYDPNVFFAPFLKSFDPSSCSSRPATTDEYEHHWAEAVRTTEKVLAATHRLAHENGAAFAVFTVPTKVQVDPAERKRVQRAFPRLVFDISKTDDLIAQWGRADGYPVINLRQTFAEAIEAGNHCLYHRFRDRHWTAAGHALAAETLAHLLAEAQLIPPAP